MKLELTTDQINQILNALAQQPYIQVHELIASIQQQGQAQMTSTNSTPLTKVDRAETKELAEAALAKNGK